MSACVCEAEFVRVSAAVVGEPELFGLYLPAHGGVYGAGRVYDFRTKRFFLVAKVNCRVMAPHEVAGGLKGLAVRVADWGVGIVAEEWVSGGRYHARVRNGAGRMTTATITALTVQVPEV